MMLSVALIAVVAAVLIATLGGGGKGGRARVNGPAGRGSGSPRNDSQIAASYLGLSPQTLRARLRHGETLGEVAESVSGRSPRGLMRAVLAYRGAELRREGLTPAQVRRQEAQLREKLARKLRRTRRLGASLAAASKYLGLDEAQLRAQLRSGHTLAQVAAAHGHSRTELLERLVRLRRERLEADLHAGTISPAQERRAIALLRRRAARVVDLRLGPS